MVNRTGTYIFIAVALLIGILLIFPFSTKDKDMLEVRLYDINGNLITSTESFAIVNDVPNVYYIDYKINLENTGELPLDMNIISISPTQFDTAMAKTTLVLAARQPGSWTSNLIPVSELGFGSITIAVNVEGSYVASGIRKTIEKSASKVISISPDKFANFTVDVGSNYTSSSIPTVVVFRREIGTASGIPNWVMYNGIGYGITTSTTTLSTYCGNSLTTLLDISSVSTTVTRVTYQSGNYLYLCKNGLVSGYKYTSSSSSTTGSSSSAYTSQAITNSVSVPGYENMEVFE